jgi:hypothetical protein
LHQYYTDDRNVTFIGIITLALTFFASGAIMMLSKYEPDIILKWYPLVSRIAKALILGLAIMLLFYTFYTVASYYLERNRDVVERDLVAEVLREDYEENAKKVRNIKSSN